MSAPRKLTDEQIAFAHAVVGKRMEAVRMLKMYPTLEQLAEQLKCSPRHLRRLLNEPRKRKPRESIQSLLNQLSGST